MAVTQDALSQCIVELRKAFGESSKEPRVIETIPKVGIRLMAPAVAADAEDAANAADAGRPAPPLAVTTRFRLSQRVALAATCIAIAAGAAWLWLPKSLDRRAGGTDEIATTSTRARECFASAGEYRQRTNRADALPREVRLYECAVEEDPSFALAWAFLSRAHLGMHWLGLDQTPGRLAQAKEAIDKALTLDPELPEAHLYLANYLYRGKRDYVAALDEFGVAERLLPENAEVYFLRASLYRRRGQWDLSIRDGEKAIELDSANIAYLREQHVSYLYQRDYESAEALLDRILDRFRDDDGFTHVDKALLAVYRNGDTQLVRRFERLAPTVDYEDVPWVSYVNWLAAVIDGDYERALNVLEREDGDPIDGEFPNSPNVVDKTLFVARTYALRGDDEKARHAFEVALRDLAKQLAGSVADDSLGIATLHLALAEAHAGLGERQAALGELTQARSLAPKSSDAVVASSIQLQSVIRVLIPLGDHETALSELEDYLRGAGKWSIEALALDPRLDPIRGDARFAALVERYSRH
jgi:tetratricopeptide (TPR) repeat protein